MSDAIVLMCAKYIHVCVPAHTYMSVADLEIFEWSFTGYNNLSHAHFEALRT